MSLERRLIKLEGRKPKQRGGSLVRKELFKTLETMAARMTHEFDLDKAAPVEVASYLLFKEEVRTDVLESAQERAAGSSPAAKLFRGILKSRGVALSEPNQAREET